MRTTIATSALILACLASTVWAQQGKETMLNDFETDADLRAAGVDAGTARLVTEGVTHGKKALEIVFDPKARYSPGHLNVRNVPRDWSAYDALVLDVSNPSGEPLRGGLLIADEAWKAKGMTYWNRHNASKSFAPGKTSWIIPVRGLFRGEAGSRNNDIKRNIDPDKIVRLDFGFGAKGAAGRVIIDNLRFVKASRPDGVWALDFGPDSQPVMLGWTAVSNKSAYSKRAGLGWYPPRNTPSPGHARDNTFPTMLLRDFVEARGRSFRIDTPPGEYQVAVFYDNCGYWGGEQSRHTKRSIAVNGKTAWSETRKDGSAHALYRFEDVEPVGVDIWDTYMAPELATPATFKAVAGEDGLTLRFETDHTWSTKVTAIAVYRTGDAKGQAWHESQLEALADEFRKNALPLDPPAPKYAPPAAWAKRGLVAWAIDIEDTIKPTTLPPAGAGAPEKLSLARLAVRGEYEPLCLAVRPMKNLGEVKLKLAAWKGPGEIEGKLSVIRYNTSRGFGTFSYRIRPHVLREVDSLAMPAGVSREFIVTSRVPVAARPGVYTSRLTLTGAGGNEIVAVPLKLTVSKVTLDRNTDFSMGFFGLNPSLLIPRDRYWEVLEETLVLLRQHGMNTVCGGPSMTLTGWRDGQPTIDFGDTDRFFALLKKHGFNKALNGYGGMRLRGLHDRYWKGKTGVKVEKESGLKYEEALMRAWKAVDAHARKNDWPTIWYAMCDETRVRAQAEKEVAFMKAMAKVSAAFPETLRTSGAYSVNFNSRPTSKDSMLYWHQRFFENLDINDLNSHDASIMAEAKKLGNKVHIYNQGRSRYSFGLYQWSEFRKGVSARTQWHLNILHGYQFFDLDGREPDTSMICYGRKGIVPTISFERCREGAEDFYLYQTLHNVLQKTKPEGKETPQYRAARELLEKTTASVKINQRRAPAGFDPNAFKARVVQAIESLTR